jgi:hypothetical protein
MVLVAIKNQGDFSRKDAKAQSATAFLNGFCFLCAFAPLREYYLFEVEKLNGR